MQPKAVARHGGRQFVNRDAWADHAGRRALGQVREQDAARAKAKPRDLEHKIQAGFIEWVRIMTPSRPELGVLYASPNGGSRHPAVAGKMKAEGQLAGIPDLCLPVARAGWSSLYLETKTPTGSVPKYQRDRGRDLIRFGTAVVVCRSIDELIDTATRYLEGRFPTSIPGNVPAEAKDLLG